MQGALFMKATDEVAAAVAEAWQEIVPCLASGSLSRKDGVAALVTGLPVPTLNGVWLEHVNPSPAVVSSMLDEVAATGLPHSLQLRPNSDRALTELAGKRGMRPDGEVPIMRLDTIPADSHPAGLSIRQLAPDEVLAHVQVATAVFHLSQDDYLRLCPPDLLWRGSFRAYTGEVNGQPVTTAVSVTQGRHTAIFSVATLPDFRGRGFGGAVTARAVADGLAAGASWCWLQSSDSGYPVYRDLGFETIEWWQLWLSAS
jgi:N-acetylglutamate synthase